VDEERLKGRILGQMTTMKGSVDFAETMIPHFASAIGGKNLTDYASWFEFNRKVLTARGKHRWTVVQVENLLIIDQTIAAGREKGIPRFDYDVKYSFRPEFTGIHRLTPEYFAELRIEYVATLDALVERSADIVSRIVENDPYLMSYRQSK
jgi:hypothetical protein